LNAAAAHGASCRRTPADAPLDPFLRYLSIALRPIARHGLS